MNVDRAGCWESCIGAKDDCDGCCCGDEAVSNIDALNVEGGTGRAFSREAWLVCVADHDGLAVLVDDEDAGTIGELIEVVAWNDLAWTSALHSSGAFL